MPGASTALKNSILDHFGNNTAWTAPTTWWVQLHTGDPGSAGTSNVATETDRQEITDWSAAASGSMGMAAALLWTAVAATETYTHLSIWSASTGGTFRASGTVTGGAVLIGGDFQLDTLVISITDP